MSQSDKSFFYKALQGAGVKFEKHYREYTTAELEAAYNKLAETTELPGRAPEPEPEQPPLPFDDEGDAEATAAFAAMVGAVGAEQPAPEAPSPAPILDAPVRARDENEMPAQRLNTQDDLTPIRTDEQGLVWYQEEVLKPAFPKPRGRRVLSYLETGTKTVAAKTGDYVETFEVAGDAQSRSAEVKITLPSYQVGIYKDRRFPFKIHVYNGNRGFDLFEVQSYYGGSELVPQEIKRIYVENVLCYDIRTTVRAIQTEYRQLQLAGKV